MNHRTLVATLLPALLNPLLATAGICTECGVNGYYYKEPGCFNITYEAPLFGADAGACFEIGGPASPFGESGPCRSVEIIEASAGCEFFLYPGLVCAEGTGRRVRPKQCASEVEEVGSFCVTCPAGSPVRGSGNTCPPS